MAEITTAEEFHERLNRVIQSRAKDTPYCVGAHELSAANEILAVVNSPPRGLNHLFKGAENWDVSPLAKSILRDVFKCR